MTLNQNDARYFDTRQRSAIRSQTANQANRGLFNRATILYGVSWNATASPTAVSILNGSAGAPVISFTNSTTDSVMGLNVPLTAIFFTSGAGLPDFTVYHEEIV